MKSIKNAMGKRLLCLLLTAAMLLTLLPTAFAVNGDKRDITPPTGKYLITQTDYPLLDGVTESQVILNDATGNGQIMGFMMTAAPTAKVTFKASYAGYYSAGSTPASRKAKVDANALTWAMEKTTVQAAAYEKATGENIVFATNGDYYNMQTAQPLGYLIMEGNVVQTGNGIALEPYFAVLKDGSFAIRDYGTDTSDVAEAVSGPFYLVNDGKNITTTDDTTLAPRNAIGLKADGSVVTFLADGRQAPYSVGMTIYETAEMMKSAGCVKAIYLDGGGSATFASVREGTQELLVRNSPSDGPERTVSSALLMVSTAAADGEFDHASLLPNNEVYTPGSAVQFTAVGVDGAGASAPLPTDLTWEVPAAAGTITAEGLFTAKEGFTGEVTVCVKRNGRICGSTEITIADIDDLSFYGEAISLDFNADSDLGLNAKYSKRDIHVKDGDFQWEIKSKTEGVADADFGTMNGNLFHSASAEGTLEGEVTVTYETLGGAKLTDTIAVEIGKLPVVIQDFEPNQDGPLTAAHFHWGKDAFHYDGSPYGEGYVGNYPSMDVITSGTYSGEPTVTTLTAPYRFTGNYDSAVPAAPIFNANGYTYYLWPNGTIAEYLAGEVKTVSREDGGQVRSGDYALELDYDYASYDGSKNANFYIRYCGDEIKIDGYPKEIGLWVYAPEGTANYSIALDVAVWNPSINDYSTSNRFLKTAAGTDFGNSQGIDWSGWMYCYTNIEDLWPSISAEHPLTIRQGEGLLWLSYQPGKNLGGRYNGTLYFDDYRVVYGTNLDDLVNPTIDALTLNGATLAEDGSTVITTQSVEIAAAFSDPESQNRTGVDASKTTIFLDGKSISVDGSDTQATTRTTLGNGHHTVTVQVADGDGNTASLTRAFTVRAEGTQNASVSVEGSDIITLGGTYVLEVKANGKVSELNLSMSNLNSDFGEPVVAFTNGINGTSEFTKTGFKKASLTLNADATQPMAGTVATITFTVPETIDPEVDFFTYQVRNITFKDEAGKEGTDAYATACLTVTAYYSIEIGTMVSGRSCEITVIDVNGKPAADVEVFLDGVSIGKTGANGILTTDAMAALAEGTTFIITARSDLGLSFETKATVFGYAGNADALPTAIRHGWVTEPSTQQALLWFSNPCYARQKAYLRYMTEAEYNALKRGQGPDTDYRTVRGASELTVYSTTKNVAYLNKVTLKDLAPDTLYYYWVGDGSEGNWSELRTFRTAAQTQEKTSFYILGDTQLLGDDAGDAEAIAALNKVLTGIESHDVDFGLQTGDFVDNGGSYTLYRQIFDVFQNSAMSDKTLLTVFGNHEYYGALNGDTPNAVLQSPARDYYSVERGDVYLAVINNNADLEKAAAWLIEDAAKSDCAWKVLSLHQPPYYTNVNGDSGKFNAILPAAADAAGIDAVFSGHDHSYARTEQLTGGKVAEDGTTYFICGDLGEKSRNLNYEAVNNPDFHFAKVSQEYDALYLIAEATEKTLTVTAYNLDGTKLDTFTKTKKEPLPPDPPVPVVHHYEYNRTTKVLSCTDDGCGEPAPKDYTGWAKDAKSGKQMYFLGGAYKTGWFTVSADTYHFDEVTGEMHRVSVVEDVLTTCSEQGHKTYKCECNETYTVQYSLPAGHTNVAKTAANGSTYYVCSRCGNISLYDLTFVDIKYGDWFAQYVDYAIRNGMFTGRTQVIFDPSAPMTRAEFVSVLWRLAGSPEFENVHSCVFKDCKLETWYTAAVNWAAKNKIVKGISDEEFGPNGKITREQIVTILYRYAEYAKLDTTATADLTKLFVDSNRVSNFAVKAVQWGVGIELLKGDNEKRLLPRDNASRAEVATMMTRFREMYKKDLGLTDNN